MKPWWVLAFGLVFGFLGGGILYLVASPPKGEPIQLQPAPTPPNYLVHVAGAVQQPGVYALPVGSRVRDAVSAGGGFTHNADSERLNLAAFIQDGERLFVPSLPPVQPSPSPKLNLRSDPGNAVEEDIPRTPVPYSDPGETLINVNTATQEELETLPGIGPAIAGRIIQYRDQHGSFTTPEDLLDVSGIGPAILEKIRPFITVEPVH